MKFIKRYLKSKKLERRTIRQIDTTIDYLIKKQGFHCKAMSETERLISSESHGKPETVVSLTTYSKRIHDVYLVIESLGQQTVKANRIVLWLDENEYSLETIPLLLKNQMDRGLDVRFYPNIRSYKKLVPSLKLFPQADIITVDDDILYPHDLIELLLRGRHLEPDSIVGVRAHTIAIDKDGVKPYRKWKYESSFEENGRNTFLTSGAGTLFPAGMLNEEFCNEKSFMELCPSADDIWINMMCIKHDIKRSKIRDDRDFSLRFLQIKDHQDIALNNENVHSNGNDLQLSKILEKYDIEI